jgi:hypothetical protein
MTTDVLRTAAVVDEAEITAAYLAATAKSPG